MCCTMLRSWGKRSACRGISRDSVGDLSSSALAFVTKLGLAGLPSCCNSWSDAGRHECPYPVPAPATSPASSSRPPVRTGPWAGDRTCTAPTSAPAPAIRVRASSVQLIGFVKPVIHLLSADGYRRRHEVRAPRVVVPPRPAPFAAIIPGDSVGEAVLTTGLLNFLQLYNTALVCRLVLTWFPNPPAFIEQPLATVTDPYLGLFRGIIPPIGGTLDLSPILAFVALNFFTSSAAALPCELGPDGKPAAPAKPGSQLHLQQQRHVGPLAWIQPSRFQQAWARRVQADRARREQAAAAGQQALVVIFRAAGGAPILQQSKVKVSLDSKFSKLVTFLRKQLQTDSVPAALLACWHMVTLRTHLQHVYLREAFTPSMDDDIGLLTQSQLLLQRACGKQERHGHAKQLVVFFGAVGIGTAGGWGADAVLRACRKVVCRPRGAGQRRGRVVLVDEHRTTRVSSAVNGKQPCEVELNTLSATRPAGWKPPAGQVEQRLLRPAWSQQRDQPVRGLMWCPVVPPRKPPQAPCSSQEATPAAASEPGPSTPQPAKSSKRTKAEPAAEPTKGKGKGKAAKAKPAPQPGRWLDRDCNAALNMQRIAESRWRPLELCYWPDQGALPAKGKEYPGLGYKRLRDKPPKAQQQQQQQQQQPAEAQVRVCERETCVFCFVSASDSGVPTFASIQQAAPLPVLPRAAAEEMMGLAWSMMCEALPEGTELPAFHPSVFDAPFGSLLPRLQPILACYPAIMVCIAALATVCRMLSCDEHEVEYRCVLSALVGFLREHDCWASLSCLLGGLRQRGLELLLGPEPPYSDSSSGTPLDAPATADAYSSLHLPGCPSHQALTALDLQSDTAPGLANGLRGLCNCPLVQPSSCWRTDSLASCNSLMLDSTEVQQPMAEAADRLPAGSQAMHLQNSSSAGNNADSSGCGSSWSASSGLSALPVLQALSGTQHQSSRCLPMAPAADSFRRKATAVQSCGMLPGAPTSHRALQGAAAAAVKYGLTLVLWLALWVLVTDMLAVCRTLLPQLFDYLAVHPSKSCQELSPAGHVPGGGAEAWLVFATGVSAAGLAVAITVGCMRGSSTQGRQQGSSRSEGGLRWPGVIAWYKADAAAAMQA
ncbi:hypothetical protein QJQ45_014802 [Haematococcus lacustris]|nr:hypothetical protein QJQ45_014802 [Haematococcus lacustris]